jgi:hypothetical protein
MIAGVAAVFLLFCGCTDLDEITQFAKASQSVGTSFSPIADEAAASCDRANSFLSPQLNSPLPCDAYPTLNPALVKVNAALFNYIASLGKLASDDLSKVAGGLDKLSDDLKKAEPGISTTDLAKASAANSLAKAITNIWASGYRQHELSKIVGDNNHAVQDVASFLSDYAVGKYLQSLKDEWRYETAYCTNGKSTAEPLASDLLARKCASDHARIELKIKAIKSYQSALETIKKTHEKLNQERGHWDSKQLLKEIGPDIVSLGSAATSINQAF